MKFHFEIDPEKDADAVGEHLRDYFFDQEAGMGCYEAFDLRDNVTRLPDEIHGGIVWKCADAIYRGNSLLGEYIKMMYAWDSDGSLMFFFPDGSAVYSNDCKKDYGWYHTYSSDGLL